MAQMRKLIPRNDHVKNKDRQDPSAVLTLCNNNLTSFLANVGYVCHTIIPELDKFTDNNRLGMYPSPISVSVAKFGWLLFLSWDSKLSSATLYRARLHSPIDKISAIRKNLPSTQVQCKNNVPFLTSPDGPVLIEELEDNSFHLKSKTITSVQRWNSLKRRFGLTLTGTLAEIRKAAEEHLKKKEVEYKRKGHDKQQINFNDKTIQDHVEAITLVDQELVYIAVSSSKRIVSAQLKYDGYGICAVNVEDVVEYSESWVSIASLCVSNNKIFASHDEGITVVDLQSHAHHMIYNSQNAKCTVIAFKKGILFTDQQRATLYQIDEHENIEKFGGGEVEGCQDGPVAECKFKQPVGACVEFDNVVYVCDAQSNSVKIVTPLCETAKFLNALGYLYDAFSVHKKGQRVPLRTLAQAVEKVGQCKDALSEFEHSVRCVEGCSEISLNGPQGMVSAATVKSVDLLHWGLKRMESVLSALSFPDTNLLSCMTLDVEHLHSTSHVKHPLLSKKEYCRDFGNTIKETTKRLSSSTFYYFTSEKNSWYPEPEHDIPLPCLPSIPPLPNVKLSEKEVEEMRNYSRTYGAAVRQRTNRQETTMARHGTMPEIIYQRHLHISERVDLSGIAASPASTANRAERLDEMPDCDRDAGDTDDEVAEYDSSSDEEETETDVSELDRGSTFLLGTTTRFGRQVRINSRLIS